MTEIWKDIPGYEGLYQVSNLGNVKSLEHYFKSRLKHVDMQIVRGKILKTRINKEGYRQVVLTKNHKSITFLVHRLVGKVFIPNPNNYPCINHKDEIKTNNNVDNLEWCTYKYNANYGTGIERQVAPRRIKVAQIDKETNKIIKIWEGISIASRTLNINHRHICEVCKGKLKSSGGYKWKYASDLI